MQSWASLSNMHAKHRRTHKLFVFFFFFSDALVTIVVGDGVQQSEFIEPAHEIWILWRNEKKDKSVIYASKINVPLLSFFVFFFFSCVCALIVLFLFFVHLFYITLKYDCINDCLLPIWCSCTMLYVALLFLLLLLWSSEPNLLNTRFLLTAALVQLLSASLKIFYFLLVGWYMIFFGLSVYRIYCFILLWIQLT